MIIWILMKNQKTNEAWSKKNGDILVWMGIKIRNFLIEPSWGSKLGFKVGVQSWGSKLGFKVGVQSWGSKLGFKVGVQSWGSKLGFKVGVQNQNTRLNTSSR
jgi:hypothetical protein